MLIYSCIDSHKLKHVVMFSMSVNKCIYFQHNLSYKYLYIFKKLKIYFREHHWFTSEQIFVQLFKELQMYIRLL